MNLRWRRAGLVAGLLCAAPSVSGKGPNWPSFRGPRAAGFASGAPVTEWDVRAGRHVVWSVPVPGHGHSSPIVWGDRVFVTTAVGERTDTEIPRTLPVEADIASSKDQSPQEWRIYCFDLRTGQVRWERTVATGVPRSKRHPFNSYATPTPATDGERLVVYFGSDGLFAYSLDGERLWSRDLGAMDAGYYGDRSFQWGTASSPVLHRNLVIVQCDVDRDPFLAAFDARDGRPVWRVARDDFPSWSSPTVYERHGRAELVTNAPHYVRGYDPSNGRELWKLYWGLDAVASTPVGDDERIYVAGGQGPTSPIYALRAGSRGDLTPPGDRTATTDVVWSMDRGGPVVTTPLVYRGLLYIVSHHGILRCYRAADGQRLYEQRLEGSFMASPIAADGRLYLTNAEGDVYVVAAGATFRLLARNVMDEGVQATPALAGDLLLVRTRTRLFAIGETAESRSEARAAGARSGRGRR